MKVVMLQLNLIVGDIVGNTDKIIKGYRNACIDGAELVVCSELSLIGYPPRDLLLLSDYLDLQDECIETIKAEVGEVGLIIGYAERHQISSTTISLYNSAMLIENGKVIYNRSKSLLPNYDVFDERRYFEPKEMDRDYYVMYRHKRISILICEDIWGGEETGGCHTERGHNPVYHLKSTGIELLVVINASPYYWGKGDQRLELVKYIAQEIETPVVYVNQVGGNDDLIFDGRSFAVSKFGECIAVAKSFSEDSVMVDTDRFIAVDYPTDTDNFKELYDALVMGTRDYLHKISVGNGVVIGLSGGIDSALTACIAVDAIGADKVVGVTMPSTFSSDGSIIDAKKLADNLGIKFDVVPIGSIYDQFAGALARPIGWYTPGTRKGDATEENVQARIRGALLMAYSNRTGKFLLTTGNKSELAVGYCTLYGDMAGGLAVISDLPKTLVYDLSKFINREQEIIPDNTITKPPSAELSPGQQDSDSLPPYDVLDKILHLYIEEQMGVGDIIAVMPDQSDIVHAIIKLVNGNEFKRRQMPPGLRVTSKAFGTGRRFPIAAKFLS